MWDGNRGWVRFKSHDDLTWEGRNTAAPLGPPDEWGAQDVYNALPCKRRQETMPGGGMPGGVGNTSGDTGELCAPAHPRHRGDTGLGQPPPTTVPPVRPSGPQEGAQRAPPGDQPVQDGDGAETATTGGVGDADHIGEGVPRLWGTDEGGDRV